jgi:hypothetical protein
MGIEQLLVEAGGSFGFAALAFVVFMIFFLRWQSGQQASAEASRKADREMIHSFMMEIVAARGESNRVIESNTSALTKVVDGLDEMCSRLEAHDEHARDIGDKVVALEGEVGQLVRKLPVRVIGNGS